MERCCSTTRWSNSPQPWHCVSLCNLGIFIFSHPPWSHLHLPLSPCLSRCFSDQFPREEMLMLSCPPHELGRKRDGTPLDFMATCLRGAEMSQECLLAREELCAQIPCEVPQQGPVQRSHQCSQALKVHRNSPEGACDHFPGTLEGIFCTAVTLHLFPTPVCPFPSQAGSFVLAADPLLQSLFSHIHQKQRAQQREFLSLCSCAV